MLPQRCLLAEVFAQMAPSLKMRKSPAYHLVSISQLMGQRQEPIKQVGLCPNEYQMCWIPMECWVHSLPSVLAGAEGCPYLIVTTDQLQRSFTWKISYPNICSATVARNYNPCYARSWTGLPRLVADAKYCLTSQCWRVLFCQLMFVLWNEQSVIRSPDHLYKSLRQYLQKEAVLFFSFTSINLSQ